MSASIYERRAKDVMSRDVVSLGADSTIHEALNLFIENRISALPVVDRRNHCVGIMTTADLVDITRDVDDDINEVDDLDPASQRWLIDKLLHVVGNEPIASYMTEDVTTVDLEAPLVVVSREMLRNRIHHLPVVDAQNRLAGIISTMDILAEFADGAPNQ